MRGVLGFAITSPVVPKPASLRMARLDADLHNCITPRTPGRGVLKDRRVTGERMTVGTCGKAHGIKGELTVFTGAPEVFVPGAAIHTEQGTLTVGSARTHNDRLLVRFVEIENRTAAETMRNVELAVDADDLPALAEDEYWVASLIDRPVRATSGEPLGVVKSVELGPQNRLVIATETGEFEVPFVAALVPEVAADYIVVDPPPGLFD